MEDIASVAALEGPEMTLKKCNLHSVLLDRAVSEMFFYIMPDRMRDLVFDIKDVSDPSFTFLGNLAPKAIQALKLDKDNVDLANCKGSMEQMGNLTSTMEQEDYVALKEDKEAKGTCSCSKWCILCCTKYCPKVGKMVAKKSMQDAPRKKSAYSGDWSVSDMRHHV